MLKMYKELAVSLVNQGVEKIYKNFPNKEALVEILIEREADKHLKILENKYAEIKGRPFEEIIETLIGEITNAMAQGKTSIRVILTSTFAVERLQSLIHARESLVTFVEKVLQDAGYKQDCRTKSYTIVAALGGMVETLVFRKNEDISNEKLTKETTKMVLAYCKL